MIRLRLLGVLLIAQVLICPLTVGAEITGDRAVQAANKAVVGDEQFPPEWTLSVSKNIQWAVSLDKDLKMWQHIKAGWQKRSAREQQLGKEDDAFGPWLTRMESVLVGKNVWGVVYKAVSQSKQLLLHPDAMVFVDADSGKVLAIISPEGAPLFPSSEGVNEFETLDGKKF